jgi:hypothetical protein
MQYTTHGDTTRQNYFLIPDSVFFFIILLELACLLCYDVHSNLIWHEWLRQNKYHLIILNKLMMKKNEWASCEKKAFQINPLICLIFSLTGFPPPDELSWFLPIFPLSSLSYWICKNNSTKMLNDIFYFFQMCVKPK